MTQDSSENLGRGILTAILMLNLVSISGFMVVMPLGVDLVQGIGFKPHHVGYLSGGSTFAGAISSFFLGPYLDGFSRRKAIAWLYTGRALLLVLAGCATSPWALSLCFILAGCFSGPGTGVLMAAVIDVTPLAKRGRAMAFVNSAFSLAAIVTIPVSLELARLVSWRLPFVAFGLGGLVLAGFIYLKFPARGLKARSAPLGWKEVTKNRAFCYALAVAAVQMFGHFLIVPNIASYFLINLKFPREDMSLLYLLGGLTSLVALRLSGLAFDRGYARIALATNCAVLIASIGLGFIWPGHVPIFLAFALFMAMASGRTSLTAAVISTLPPPNQRAQYMAWFGMAGSLSAGLAASFSSQYLVTNQSGSLIGLETLAGLACLCTVLGATLMLARVIPRAPLAGLNASNANLQTSA